MTHAILRRDALRMWIAGSGLWQLLAPAQPLPVWTVGKVAVPGGSVVSRTFGGGRKAPLLLVHGGPSGADSRAYATMSALGDERQLISWDQLDCGDSDHPNRPENWRHARFVEEMDTVRRKLAPGPVHVLGGSWGSTLIMEWLVTKRPRNVLSVTFLCPAIDYTRTEASRRNAQQKLSPSSVAAFEEFTRTGDASKPAYAQANAEYVRTFVTRNPPPGMYGSGRPNPDMMKALFVDWKNWTRVKELAQLRQPLLLVRGEHDYITDEDVAFYAAARPGTETAVIPHAAHLTFFDNAEATNAVVRRFLQRAEG
jgi:proline iminopeptidase